MRRLICLCVTAGVLSAVSAATARGSQATNVSNPSLRSFIEQVEREWPGDARQQAITVESVTLLANTVESIASSRQALTPDLRTVLDRLRTEIRRFETGTAGIATQSVQLRHVLTTATDLLARLAGNDAAKEPAKSRLAALRRSVDGLDGKTPLRRQPDVLERYFHQAAELLRDVSNR